MFLGHREDTTTSVRVICRIGESTYARATADVFEGGILTICWADGRIAEQYPPDRWRSVAVYDAEGYPLYEHFSPAYPIRLREVVTR